MTSYVDELAAQLLSAEGQIAAQYGNHLRPSEAAIYTRPSGGTELAVIQAAYFVGDDPAVDVLLVTTGETVKEVAPEKLGPLPELPDLGERIENRWLITDKFGEVLAHVEGADQEEALTNARRLPDVRAVSNRDGGLAIRPLWTADLTARCKHCGEEIEHLDETGWVETREGGHYDMCPDSPDGFDGAHQPHSA